MKWKGTVSQSAKTYIATRFSSAKMPQATSTHRKPRVGHAQRSGRVNPVPLPADRFDGLPADLGTKPADVDIDDIRARVEVIPPDGGEQVLLTDGVAGARHQLAQQEKLALGELDAAGVRLHLTGNQVQRQVPDCDASARRAGITQASPDSRQQLFNREGLDEVVVRARLQGADLRGGIAER